jgi:hypothetical protein
MYDKIYCNAVVSERERLGRTVDRLLKAIEDRNRGESWPHYNNNMIYLQNALLYAPVPPLTDL